MARKPSTFRIPLSTSHLSRFTPRFKTDPGLLVALWLATFAAWPFLTRAGLPTFTDAEQHVYRVYEVMEAWKAGV